MSKKKEKRRYVLVGNGLYGLYVGWWAGNDADAIRDKAVRLEECRHVRYWYGRSGGITSLAAHGPCGPRMMESRIGAPSPSNLINDVRTIFDCTDEAVAQFTKIEAR